MKIKGDSSLRSRKIVDNGNCLHDVLSFISRYLLLSPLIFLSLLTSCSTEKAKWTNIQYHNTTCHYNVWWNGNESLKAGKQKLRTQAVDDYTRFLPPENIGSDDLARSLNPEFDRAIEKGVKGIKKHSIFVKGVEHVPYIKECYLLTAYATFYKHDYISTANTCNILLQQFQGTSAGDQGAILLARCMTMEKHYEEAESTLDQLVNNLGNGNFSRSQRDKLYCAMVEATVPQEKYKKAVEYIHYAIDASSDRYTKARLSFLLAQIYRKLEKRTVAAKYYDEVLHYRPPYVLEFNAKLGRASCADPHSLSESELVKLEKQLDDMLKDKKNEEYRDQIYFAKGEMFLGVKQPQKACDNYRLSVAAATVNKAQRAQSALRMGEVQYEIFENYDLAQRYYDTAMQCITRDYPNYDYIRRRYDMLTELTSYTRVYERCDSLLAVAAMPEQERLQLINDKIDELKKKEEAEKERALMVPSKTSGASPTKILLISWRTIWLKRRPPTPHPLLQTHPSPLIPHPSTTNTVTPTTPTVSPTTSRTSPPPSMNSTLSTPSPPSHSSMRATSSMTALAIFPAPSRTIFVLPKATPPSLKSSRPSICFTASSTDRATPRRPTTTAIWSSWVSPTVTSPTLSATMNTIVSLSDVRAA